MKKVRVECIKIRKKALYWYKTAYDNGFLGAAENYYRLLIEK